MRKIIASLDIGDYLIKLIVGEVFRGKVNVLTCVSTPSRGIKKGFVVNVESASLALQDVFDKAEKSIGIRPTKVLVSVPSNNCEFFLSEGYTSINNEENIVTHNDIVRSLQSCVYNKVSENRELISILPIKFLINDSDVVSNPINLKAQKLNVKAVCVTIPKQNVIGIVHTLDKIGVKVIDMALGALGDYYEFKDKLDSNVVGAIVNIGASITNVSIFNKGIITKNEVIDIGGDLIDYDLAYVYKITRNDAIHVKENLAIADIHKADASESYVINNKIGENIKINQYDASEIMISRLNEILNLVKKQINLLTKKEISYIMFTGGVTETAEFKYACDALFNNSIVASVNEIGVRNNSYSSCIGLIKYYDSRLRLRNKDFSIYTIEEQEQLSGMKKKINISEDSILGKLFGYFFDN